MATSPTPTHESWRQASDAASPPGREDPQREHRERDDERGGGDEEPVHVQKEPAVESEHQEPSPSPTIATLSRKSAW